jgi:ribonucleoside-diphosphate reductase alpha chain
MIRRRLPNRRPAVTHDLEVEGRPYKATVGFDEIGRPRELFLSGGKPGSDLDAMLADIGVAVSVALQSGVSAEAMAASIGRAGSPPAAISPVGTALDLLAEYERDTA